MDYENRVFEKWTKLANFLEGFFGERAEDYLERLTLLVGEKVARECSQDTALAAYDEDIFRAYEGIMKAYKAVAKHHVAHEGVLETAHVREVWNGIYELIMSRLMADREGADSPNPILAEKQGIVADSVAEASRALSQLLEAPAWADISRPLLAGTPCFADFDKALEAMAGNILDTYSKDIYDTFRQVIESALASLNNLETRGQASGYNNLLKEEVEILRQIIVVQAMALEKAIWEGSVAPAEGEFLGDALTLLREAYQREGHAYASINKAFFEAAARHRENLGRVVADIEPSEDFFDELGTVPAALDLPVLFEVFKAGFADNHAAFKAELDDAFNEMQSSFSSNIQSKKIYFCKKSIWQSGQMAEEFCAAFAHISKHFEKHSEELLTHEHGDIIKGVHETIGIKVETLRDAAQEFFTDADGKIESFGDEASGGADSQEFARVGTEFVLEWLFEIECLDSEFVKYIFDEFGKSDAFAGATAAITRAWDKREDIINKKIAAFMRDNLFFELTTFEEIMHYSVSRLRETEDAAVATFVEEIDKQHKHLDAILTKHDIEKITPAAHEPFNAKEHEVLMAELNPDFKKGEIIKTMNSGYKKGEQVIVRANVIAAR